MHIKTLTIQMCTQKRKKKTLHLLFCAGVQLRALQAARPYLPGEGEYGATPGATGGRAGLARSHAHVTLHRATPGRGRLLGRETEGGWRGVGTMAGGPGPVAVSGGSVQ